ncbi:MAG: hypothetical protein JWP08_1920 [Bryobacterales bacterium]|nr:hypothetical protein [Bryobacterales bacterium]
MIRNSRQVPKPNHEYPDTIGPTIERKRHSEGFYEVGGVERSNQKYTMLDSPLTRLRCRGAIGGMEYAALRKYANHWYCGGLSPSLSSIDLDRVFASDPGSMSGMAKSEGQAHHRGEYRRAREIIGHRPGIIVDNVVCAEWPLHIAGHSIGYSSPYRARLAATEILRDAGYRLAQFWGMK